jgi:hypothetical protein
MIPFVQQWIELGPDLVFLRARHVAERALGFGPQLGRRCLRLMVIEVVVTPASGVGIALGIFDRNVGAVQLSGEVTPPGGLGARSIRVLGWERQLQFLEEDRPLRERTCLLVDLV